MLYFVVLYLLATLINAQIVAEDVLCEGRFFEPNCLQGTVRVVSASFGKTDAAFCGGKDPQPWSVNCGVDVAENLRQSCQGKNGCSVRVEGQDVCSGTSKYLQVIWACDTTIPQNRVNNRGINIVVSDNAARTNPVSLHGLSVGSQLYVFLNPPAGISQVRWYIDQPNQVFTTETESPFDLRGGRPWNSTTLSDGQHRIIAVITFSDDTSGSIDATFTVKKVAPDGAARAVAASTEAFVEPATSTSEGSSQVTPVVPWSLFGVACAVIVALVIVLIVKINNSAARRDERV